MALEEGDVIVVVAAVSEWDELWCNQWNVQLCVFCKKPSKNTRLTHSLLPDLWINPHISDLFSGSNKSSAVLIGWPFLLAGEGVAHSELKNRMIISAAIRSSDRKLAPKVYEYAPLPFLSSMLIPEIVLIQHRRLKPLKLKPPYLYYLVQRSLITHVEHQQMSVCLKLRKLFAFMDIGELSCTPAGVRCFDTKSRGIGLVHRF